MTGGTTPQSVAIGDFNNDAVLDLAVANFGSGDVSVLLGTGGGSFAAADTYAVGCDLSGIVVGDFDGDGNSDLAVSDRFISNASVLLGDGNGLFGTAANYLVLPNPRSIVSGDFNGDGYLDLATVHANHPTIEAFSVLHGQGTHLSNVQHTTIEVAAVNDAPVLDAGATPVLAAVNEDAAAPTGPVGTLISDLVDFAGGAGINNVTDADGITELTGIALTGADGANGTWYYTVDGGDTWDPVGTVSDASALLLAVDPDTRLYFQPADDFNGAANITFRAWDQTTGSNGETGVNTVPNGDDTAFSAATDTAAITINAVNDAPVLDAGQSPVLEIVQEDAGPPFFFPVGTLVADLVGPGNVTDADDGALIGMAITGADESNGTWWYTTNDGFDWFEVGPVDDTSALVLAADADTRLYFEAAPGFTDSATITFRAWDQTDGSDNGQDGVNAAPGGGISAFSAVSDTATVEVNAQPVINDVDGDAVTFTEGNSFVIVDATPVAASVADIDSPDLEDGDLFVEFCGCFITDDDELFIRTGNGITVNGTDVLYNGDVIGEFFGGVGFDPLMIFFTTADATPAAASALVRQIAYRNTNIEEPIAGVRTVSFSVTDGDGGLSFFSDATVEVITVNDAPTLAAVPGATYTDTAGNDTFTAI